MKINIYRYWLSDWLSFVLDEFNVISSYKITAISLPVKCVVLEQSNKYRKEEFSIMRTVWQNYTDKPEKAKIAIFEILCSQE